MHYAAGCVLLFLVCWLEQTMILDMTFLREENKVSPFIYLFFSNNKWLGTVCKWKKTKESPSRPSSNLKRFQLDFQVFLLLYKFFSVVDSDVDDNCK